MTYSQLIEKVVHIDNTCARCESKFKNWTEYHIHATTINCIKRIRPINITGRSKAQIVADFELKHKGAIL